MFWYSDSVVAGNAPVEIDIFTQFKPILDSDIHIYKEGNVVYTGKFDSLTKHITLEPLSADLEFFTIVISNKTFHHSLPWTAMRLNPQEPYIICDIDFTISATNAFMYMMKKIVGLKTIGNSVDVLTKLSQKYKIIYLTGRIERYTKMSRIWLENNGYPIGPILARPKKYPMHLATFKTEILQKIASISSNGVGIGDLKSDITAYIAGRIIPIKLKHPFNYYKSTNREYKFKDGYYLAKSWSAIQRLFDEQSFYI